MTSELTGAKNQPYFLATGAPDIAVDPGLVSDYAADVGNRKVGTGTNRLSVTGKDVWEGLEWEDTTDKCVYKYRSGGWVKVFEDTGWLPLTLANSWTAFGGAYEAAQYRRLNGMVIVQGTLRNSAGAGAGRTTPGAVIGSLPAGFRPAKFHSWVVPQDGGSALVELGSNGNIVVGQINVSPVRLAVDAVMFPAEV